MLIVNKRPLAKSTALPHFKRVIPALLLSSMALPMTAPAQEPSAAPSSEDAAMDEFLDQFSTAAPENGGAEPTQPPAAQQNAADESAAGTGQASQQPAPDATQAPTATATEQPAPAASNAPPEAAELDVIPVPQREAAMPEVKEAPQGRQIEEIVVTAQKREQVSQDVPISMSVMSETFIKEQGITNVADALLFVPNFKVREFANTSTPQCRGFTVDEANPAFEPPCGFALDGVAFARAAYFGSGLFDLQRMEVLRGPQGTTFGKNTTAGVVSLVSKDPTDEFTANFDLQYGLEGAQRRRAEAAVGGPLIPGVVNFRVAGMRELREGYMENTYADIDPSVPDKSGGRDSSTYRVKLTFPDVLGSTVKLLHERSESSAMGLVAKVFTEEGSSWDQYLRQYDPNIDFGENYKQSVLGSQADTVMTRSQGEWSHSFGDWGVTLLGATGELKNDARLNPAAYPVPFVFSHRGEESPFITAELRATSPDFDGLFGLDELFGVDLGSSNMLVGVFGQRQELRKLEIDVDLYYVGTVGVLAASGGAPLPVSVIDQLVHQQFGGSAGESFYIDFSQKAETAALFGQFTWNMTEQWSLDLGVRLSRETKEADWQLSHSDPAPIFNPGGTRSFVADKRRSNENFQPKISLGYRLTQDINLFAHWARAFKSGGYNAFVITGNPEQPNPTRGEQQTGSLDYDDEVATEWGFDAKMTLLDNRMRLNLSLFRLDVDDFQVLTAVPGTELPGGGRLPDGYQEVINAAKARSQGAELDLTWLAADWLTVIAAVGYNDTEYLSFPLATCSVSEEPDPDTGRCDHTGYSFTGIPKWSNTLTLDTRFPLGGMWSALGDTQFLLGGTVEHVGSHSVEPNNDRCCVQEEYFRYRAHAGFSNPSQGWSFRVTGLNLSDEYIYVSRGFDAGLGTGSPMPPRSVFAQFSWSY